jgi:glucose-6-phosphatase
LAVYGGLQVIGLDPDWSVARARRYCAHASWVYVDTTPFYALVRYSGAGLGLACVYKHYWQQQGRRLSASGRVGQLIQLVVGLLLGALTGRVHARIPHTNPVVFYSLELALNAFNVIAIISLPFYVTSTMYSSAKDTKLKK